VSPSGAPWSIRAGEPRSFTTQANFQLPAGAVVVIEPGSPAQENVRGKTSDGATFTADLVRAHPAGATILLTDIGDRVPGRSHTNALWDPETLQAIVDPQSSNTFQSPPAAAPTATPATKVYDPANPFLSTASIFGDLITSRSPNLALPAGATLGST